MDNATDTLCELLEAMGLPYFRQGAMLSDESYPASFFTFWEAAADETHFDDGAVSCLHRYFVYYYTNDPTTVPGTIKELRNALHENGFATSAPVDCKSDERSHIGKAFDVLIKKFYREDD